MDTQEYQDYAKLLDAAPDQEAKDAILAKIAAKPGVQLDDDFDSLKKFHG